MSMTTTTPISTTKSTPPSKKVSLIVTHQERIRNLLYIINKKKNIIVKGSKVKHKYVFFPGIITEVNNTDGTYNIKYDDNERGKNYNNVNKDLIELLEVPRFKDFAILRLDILQNMINGVIVCDGELVPNPVTPVTPVTPVATLATLAPVAPVAPVATLAPVAPVAPVSPVAPDEGGYYESKNNNTNVISTSTNEEYNEMLDILNLKDIDFSKGIDEYVFYIVILGETQYNQINNQLTLDSQNNAIKSGKLCLYELLNNNKEIINYVFASDLTRTTEAIKYIINGINQGIRTDTKNTKEYFPGQIIILPCSHEIDVESTNTLDKVYKLISSKNKSKCSTKTYCVDKNVNNPESDCNSVKTISQNSGNKIIPLHWDFYFEKNQKKMRNMDCSKTNMIQLAVEYININTFGVGSVVSSGTSGSGGVGSGGKKTKKTKKLKKKFVKKTKRNYKKNKSRRILRRKKNKTRRIIHDKII